MTQRTCQRITALLQNHYRNLETSVVGDVSQLTTWQPSQLNVPAPYLLNDGKSRELHSTQSFGDSPDFREPTELAQSTTT